jgi:sortase A
VTAATPVTLPVMSRPAPAAHLAAGAVLGRLIIPRLGLNVVVRQGTSASVLATGPGHYPGTSLPGQGGTIAVAGHRVTHTRPFLQLNRLRKNDTIVFETRTRYVYRVFLMRIVPTYQIWPLHRRATEQLVLTACHPPGTSRSRIVVFARRVP